MVRNCNVGVCTVRKGHVKMSVQKRRGIKESVQQVRAMYEGGKGRAGRDNI